MFARITKSIIGAALVVALCPVPAMRADELASSCANSCGKTCKDDCKTGYRYRQVILRIQSHYFPRCFAETYTSDHYPNIPIAHKIFNYPCPFVDSATLYAERIETHSR